MKKTIIKRVGKSFRLVDFHIFNRKGELFKNDDSMSEDSDDQAKWNEQENFIIQMFGINEKGETCCVYLNDYKPFFYIKVGDDWDESAGIGKSDPRGATLVALRIEPSGEHGDCGDGDDGSAGTEPEDRRGIHSDDRRRAAVFFQGHHHVGAAGKDSLEGG